MSESSVGLLAVLVYLGAVLAAIPASLVVYGLGGFLGSTRRALGYVAAVLAGLVLAATAALAVFVTPAAGATVAVLGGAAAVVLYAFPLFVGRQLLGRWTPLDPDDALEYAVLGLPVALVASFALFLAPGGTDQYNLTFLSGPVAALVWTALGLVVTLGPGLAGLGMYRLVDRLG